MYLLDSEDGETEQGFEVMQLTNPDVELAGRAKVALLLPVPGARRRFVRTFDEGEFRQMEIGMGQGGLGRGPLSHDQEHSLQGGGHVDEMLSDGFVHKMHGMDQQNQRDVRPSNMQRKQTQNISKMAAERGKHSVGKRRRGVLVFMSVLSLTHMCVMVLLVWTACFESTNCSCIACMLESSRFIMSETVHAL